MLTKAAERAFQKKAMEFLAKHYAWKKIKTAPQGEPVLVYNEDWEMTMGSTQVGILLDGEWQVEAVAGFAPTHWRPLPEPPHGRR